MVRFADGEHTFDKEPQELVGAGECNEVSGFGDRCELCDGWLDFCRECSCAFGGGREVGRALEDEERDVEPGGAGVEGCQLG